MIVELTGQQAWPPLVENPAGQEQVNELFVDTDKENP